MKNNKPCLISGSIFTALTFLLLFFPRLSWDIYANVDNPSYSSTRIVNTFGLLNPENHPLFEIAQERHFVFILFFVLVLVSFVVLLITLFLIKKSNRAGLVLGLIGGGLALVSYLALTIIASRDVYVSNSNWRDNVHSITNWGILSFFILLAAAIVFIVFLIKNYKNNEALE